MGESPYLLSGLKHASTLDNPVPRERWAVPPMSASKQGSMGVTNERNKKSLRGNRIIMAGCEDKVRGRIGVWSARDQAWMDKGQIR